MNAISNGMENQEKFSSKYDMINKKFTFGTLMFGLYSLMKGIALIIIASAIYKNTPEVIHFLFMK